MHLVDELPQRVERLVACVGADPLQGLHLVEHDQQAPVAAVAQDDQQPLDETEGTEVVEVPAYPGCTPGGSGDVRLTGQPGENGLRSGLVAGGGRGPVAAQRSGEGGGCPADIRQPPLEQITHRSFERRCVGRIHPAGRENIVLQGVEPGVHDRAQRARWKGRGGQPFGESTVDRFQAVQRRLVLGDLHLCCCKVQLLSPLGQPAGEERLPGAVLPPHGFEDRASRRNRREVVGYGALESTQADREQIKARLGHRSAAQRVEHVPAPHDAGPGTGPGVHRSLPDRPNCSRSRTTSSRTVRLSSINESTG